MNYKLLISPEAELDIEEAFEWYEESNPGLGYEFVRVVDSCLAGIGRNLLAYPLVHQEIRRALIRRFPYGIFYLFEEDTIIVIACFHVKRDPQQWQCRSD
ncbi:type II toxin-antitoxin system RelE/ParE family toxin [Fischerella sp. PCC 9605]|uniref:type II toxin-antitoxin system RelE/ParE family toxin n=1 Tax=Fischerella sp. PCC 9605 TaxID=1173024 RepID=UPI00047BBD8F|nr:type II toxin-antitoxin system RelE/ParE family toxin [Fischerella sp. PCC 9605]